MNNILEIKNLAVSVPEKDILKNFNLTIKAGEVHAIMGPNGTGKSTLANVIAGKRSYIVKGGQILLNGEDLMPLEVDERARKGIFLAFQYPEEIPGVSNLDFLKSCLKSVTGKDISLFDFYSAFDQATNDLKMPSDLSHRYLNEGFSGGEKKRNEILQMKLLKPKFAILDEIDSGLDVDALKLVGENVQDMVGPDFGCLLITHYERLLTYIKPTHVHIMLDGRIVKSGGYELIKKIDQEGYDWVKEELGLEDDLETKDHVILSDCAIGSKNEGK